MRFEVLDHINVRTRDGRVFASLTGRQVEFDDADVDLCDAIREQAAREPATVRILDEPDDEPLKAELVDELRSRGLPVSGTKDELLDRLEAADKADAAEAAKAPAAKATKAAPAKASGANA